MNTSGLPAGIATGIVTVSDPNAVDAPRPSPSPYQIGGAVPSTLNVYMAPGTTRDMGFSTNSQIGATVRTNDGGRWLSLALDGTGSFRFSFQYRIHFAPSTAMAQGTYRHHRHRGSSFTADDRTIQVTMQVTAQPIAQPSTDHLRVRLAQARRSTSPIFLSPTSGTEHSASRTRSPGCAWIAATFSSISGMYADAARVPYDPKGLAPGTYSDAVTISSNAVAYAGAQGDKTSLTVPVDLEIVAAGPPVVDFQGVLDNAIFAPGDTIARGDIVAVEGQQSSMLQDPRHRAATRYAGGRSQLLDGVQIRSLLLLRQIDSPDPH